MFVENDKEKYREQLGNILLFKFLSDREIGDMLSMGEIRVYEEQERVLHQGEIDQSIYAIIDGPVGVNVGEKKKKGVYICTIGEGEVFGEAGLFLKVKRTANVDCLGPTILFRLTRQELIRFIKKYPTTGNKLLMVVIYSLLNKLREANQELAFERRVDVGQADVDSIVNEFTGNGLA
jgi:CRP-like cAMP-binding protein